MYIHLYQDTHLTYKDGYGQMSRYAKPSLQCKLNSPHTVRSQKTT